METTYWMEKLHAHLTELRVTYEKRRREALRYGDVCPALSVAIEKWKTQKGRLITWDFSAGLGIYVSASLGEGDTFKDAIPLLEAMTLPGWTIAERKTESSWDYTFTNADRKVVFWISPTYKSACVKTLVGVKEREPEQIFEWRCPGDSLPEIEE